MLHRITVLPQQRNIDAAPGENLLQVLGRAGLPLDAPCGGEGRCGKCRVLIDGEPALACQITVTGDMTVTLPPNQTQNILTEGIAGDASPPRDPGSLALAFDIGTTTVVGYLLEGNRVLASASAGNPQTAFGADVVTRIQQSLQGQQDVLTELLRVCLRSLTEELCRSAGILPSRISLVSVVGNPAMQQFLLGIPLDNLARAPFAPVLTQSASMPAGAILPQCENAQLLIIPNIAGFVGADTVACILAAGMDTREEITLLVDIGTNGEMVLGNRHRMMACSTAAGPALEGAGIHFGMRGQDGAIDHVWLQDGKPVCSVLGGGRATGICGSGLIDAVAAALDMGLLSERGNILTEDKLIHLTDSIYLTQEDIRQVQLAKGAIAAGIRLLAARMDISLEDIQRVLLAGAFGTYMDPGSACRIGLLPGELAGKITAAGNAAGSGARLLAWDPHGLERAQAVAAGTHGLELSTLPEFARCFAKSMRF